MKMNEWTYIGIGVTVFGLLLWLWPNIVHEPVHLMALKIQGSDGHMNLDWSFPPRPTTTRTEPVKGIAGGLFFSLAPSLLSMAILTTLFMRRRTAAFLTHVVLGSYLCFDLFANIIGYKIPTSDFHFLILTPSLAIISAIATLIYAIALIGMWRTVMNKNNEATDVI